MSIVVIGTSLGDVSLKRGMSMIKVQASSPLGIFQAVVGTLTNFWVDLGILLMIVQFVAWAKALGLAPYSLAIPLRASAYILTAFLAIHILHEQVKLMRWVGIIIVLLGVIMVGISSKRR